MGLDSVLLFAFVFPFLGAKFLEMASGCMPTGDITGRWRAVCGLSRPRRPQPSALGHLPCVTCFPPCPPFFPALLLYEWWSLQGRPLFIPFLSCFLALPSYSFMEYSTCFSNPSSNCVIFPFFF